MSENKKQRVTRFDDAELSLIKNTFSEREDILFAIRKVMFQVELSEAEKLIIDSFKGNEKLNAILRKFFLPSYVQEVLDNVPLLQVADIALGLGNDLRDKDPEFAWSYLQAKQLEKNYLNQQLDSIASLESFDVIGSIRFKDLQKVGDIAAECREYLVNAIAFNFILNYIDSILIQIKTLAGLKEETPEETIKRLQKNSSK